MRQPLAIDTYELTQLGAKVTDLISIENVLGINVTATLYTYSVSGANTLKELKNVFSSSSISVSLYYITDKDLINYAGIIQEDSKKIYTTSSIKALDEIVIDSIRYVIYEVVKDIITPTVSIYIGFIKKKMV